MFALILEDGFTGSQEIVAESKSFNKLVKMLEEYIEEGYNECLLNVVKLEDQ